MKNKSLVANICLAVLSVLVIAFLALPYVGVTSGYDTFEALRFLNGIGGGVAFVYIAPLFMLLAGLVLLVFSVLNILGDLNVIKSEKFLKISRVMALVAAVVVALFALIALICICVEGAEPAAGLIINLILALTTVAGTSLVFVWGRK